MIVNPGKFQLTIIDKRKRDYAKEYFEIGDKVIEASPSVKLLGVQIDDKLNFNLHITNICRSVSNPSNALIRLQRFAAKVPCSQSFLFEFQSFPFDLGVFKRKIFKENRTSAKKSTSLPLWQL